MILPRVQVTLRWVCFTYNCNRIVAPSSRQAELLHMRIVLQSFRKLFQCWNWNILYDGENTTINKAEQELDCDLNKQSVSSSDKEFLGIGLTHKILDRIPSKGWEQQSYENLCWV